MHTSSGDGVTLARSPSCVAQTTAASSVVCSGSIATQLRSRHHSGATRAATAWLSKCSIARESGRAPDQGKAREGHTACCRILWSCVMPASCTGSRRWPFMQAACTPELAALLHGGCPSMITTHTQMRRQARLASHITGRFKRSPRKVTEHHVIAAGGGACDQQATVFRTTPVATMHPHV